MVGYIQFMGNRMALSGINIGADLTILCERIAERGKQVKEVLLEDCQNIPIVFMEYLRVNTQAESISFHSCWGVQEHFCRELAKNQNIRELIIIDSPCLYDCLKGLSARMVYFKFFKYLNGNSEFIYKSYHAKGGYLLMKDITYLGNKISYIKHIRDTKHTEYGSWDDYCLIRKSRLFSI